MNLYHSEEDTLKKVANIMGLEIIDAEVDGSECYAFATVQNPEKVIYGPVVDGEPLYMEGVADHLLEILNEMDPDEIDCWQIYRVLEKKYEYGNFAYIYALAEIITICDELIDFDFFENTEMEAAQQIIDQLIEIVEDVQR